MKRLGFNISIFLGCFVLLIVILGAVLVLAPGMELMGVMFIRSTSGAVHQAKKIESATAYKQIYVETDNIPVHINFVQSYTVTANFLEEYNGFAKASATPSVSVEVTTNGIEIKSDEYEPFLVHSRSKESKLLVSVPMYYHNKLVVKGGKSNVIVGGLPASLSDVFISTDGKVELNNDINVKNLELDLGNKDATIGEDVNIQGYIIVNSKAGDVSVPEGFTGNISFTSTSGNLNIASCGDLNYTSKTGSVLPYNDKKAEVFGKINIETNGDVTLGNFYDSATVKSTNGDVTIGTEGETNANAISIESRSGDITLLGSFTNKSNKISSRSGDIIIEEVKGIAIESTYGNITLVKADAVSVKTKTGNVNIKNLISHSEITTNNGDVTIGTNNIEEGSAIGGATITTIGGDIVVLNASGETYSLKTNSGNIDFTQEKGAKCVLNISSNRGDVSLVNVYGAVNATTNGSIYVDVYKMGGKIDLTGKNRNVNVILRDTAYFDLTSKKNIKSAPNLKDDAKTFFTVPLSGNHDDSVIKITTNKGKIAISKI